MFRPEKSNSNHVNYGKKRSDSELSKKNGGIIRPKEIFSKHFGLIHLAGLRVLKHFGKNRFHLFSS